MQNLDGFKRVLEQLGATWVGELPDASAIVDDSREVGQGDYFIVRDGTTLVTPELAQSRVNMAIMKGAAVVISHVQIEVPEHVVFIHLAETQAHLLELAQAFYGKVPSSMKLVAVTGTNGKTTTTYLIESIARNLGMKVGVMGTVTHRYPGYVEASENTTPGTLKLYRLLAGMREAGCTLVVMEVSSHAICQARIAGLRYDVAIWNNLGVDHLDYHKTREAYGEAKQQLFSKYLAESFAEGHTPCAVVNAADADVMRLIEAANPQVWGGRVMKFSADATVDAEVKFGEATWENNAWHIQAKIGDQSMLATLPLLGRYNVANGAGAACALLSLGISAEAIIEALSKVDQVPGRMQVVRAAAPRVIVDFAHTPEALESALKATRESMTEGLLTVVFGCGGDRDASKRPMMASRAQKNADRVVVTSDNPRTEDANAIINDICEGFSSMRGIIIEPDRLRAIELALTKALDNDRNVVVIAGKGHEDYQILGTQKTHFSDVEEVEKFFARK